MKKLLVAMTLLSPLQTRAFAAKIISDKTSLKSGAEVRIVVDQGRVIVIPTNSPALSYRVEFVPSQSGWFGPKAPTSESYENSGASYNRDKETLTVRTGANLNAQVTVYVPAAQSVDFRLAQGVADIGALTGRLKAFVDSGILRYDSSALPEGSCVMAFARHGSAHNAKESDCMEPDALLRVANGYVSAR